MTTPLPRRIIVAVTGASGSRYARLLVERLLALGGDVFADTGASEVEPRVGFPVPELSLSVIVTRTGLEVMTFEDEVTWMEDPRLTLFENENLFAAPASGSSAYDAMVVIPCSMGMVGRLAAGVSDDLISRSADVMLKERRSLILVTRETPLHTIHLRNMTTLSECGALICPASPSFYSRPADLDSVCLTVVERVIALLGLPGESHPWLGR